MFGGLPHAGTAEEIVGGIIHTVAIVMIEQKKSNLKYIYVRSS